MLCSKLFKSKIINEKKIKYLVINQETYFNGSHPIPRSIFLPEFYTRLEKWVGRKKY